MARNLQIIPTSRDEVLKKQYYNGNHTTMITKLIFVYLMILMITTGNTNFVFGATAESGSIFYKWIDCSYLERLDNGTSRRVAINNNFEEFYDIPFGFGCREIYFPDKIMSIPFGTAYLEDKNTNIFSPVKPSGENFNLCAKYSNVSCVDTFCNGSNSTESYELLNYCQYCSEGKDFVEFHNLIIDIDNYSDTKMSKCPLFTRFPSAFFCEDVQAGFPVYFMDQYFERLRTPFLCYCHRYDTYSNLCDPVMFSLLRTDAVNMIKFILSLLISIPLCPFAIFGYVVPEFVTMIHRRKLRVFDALCALLILVQSICVVVASAMFSMPSYDSFNTLFFTTSLALSLNVFFTHYGSLAVLLVFDRICQYLKSGDNKNSLVAYILIGISFISNSLCAIYIISYLLYELETQQLNIILTGLSYVSYSLPWFVNFLVFIYISKKLAYQLQDKTHLSFYKSKVSFLFYNFNY